MEEKKCKRWRPSLTAYRALEKENERLREDNDALKRSNEYMEEELKRRRGVKDDSKRIIEDLMYQIERYRNRGFWARVFNK